MATTWVHACAAAGKLAPLREAIEADGIDVNLRDERGRTAMHAAVDNRKHHVLEYLLSRNEINAEVKTNHGHTPLHTAMMEGNDEAIRLLLRHNVNLNDTTDSGASYLHVCIAYGAENVRNNTVRRLLDLGMWADLPDDDGDTPLVMAIIFGHFDIMRVLIERGADVSSRNKSGITPLHHATMSSQPVTTINLLMDHGANICATDNDGHTPLALAFRHKRSCCVNALRAHGAEMDELMTLL